MKKGLALSTSKGFTLIELLVVVAIIGVLASVVLASLNSARDKGKAAAIKSNLKNMIPEAELAYDTAGNYSTACTATAKMLTAIAGAGATTSCLSYYNLTYSDVYLRFGASGIIYGAGSPIRAWSVSNVGVVAWDAADLTGANLPGGATKSWDDAMAACAANGGRLPTMEELKTLIDATYAASGNTSYTPPSFAANFYWSNTAVPSNGANAYGVWASSGALATTTKTSTYYVRCVR